jgi:inosine/xanthosine triphosphatase
MAFPKRKNLQEQTRQNLVIIGSRNPVKVRCTEEAFNLAWGTTLVQGLNVDSGVRKQPIGDTETYAGAYNRAVNSKTAFPEADFWVGIEGGVEEIDENLTAFAWIVILDAAGKTGRARTAAFFLPQVIRDLVKGGMELGEADDQVFRTDNSKHAGGAVGILTKGIVERKELYKQAVSLALIPFVKPDLY